MTIEEAQYFKDYIDSKLNEIFSKLPQEDAETVASRTFAARHMVGITGQQMLPQDIFRTFLSEVDIMAVKRLCDGFREDIDQNTENINTNTENIAANKTSISELQYMLENDYYDTEIIVAMLDDKADAEKVDTLQSSLSALESKVTTNTTNIAANDKDIYNLWSSVSSCKTSINSIGTIQNDLIDRVNNVATNYNMFVTLDGLAGGVKALRLDDDFSQLVYSAMDEYQGTSEEEDSDDDKDNVALLRSLSGKYILPTLKGSSFDEIRSGVHHFLHFLPWQMWFYDKVDTYNEDMISGKTNATLLIRFQQDTIDYLSLDKTPIGLRLNTGEKKWEYIDENEDTIDYYDL